ncbi:MULTISPECIES: DUF6625 family protein [Blautia]|uniref:DUF6625 family protein n=1 Tax=Blautia TaxID=572511 RepID=UPI0035664875
MKKICICSVYMGKLPNTIDFWINSIRNNSSIDFVLFTDESAKNIRGGGKQSEDCLYDPRQHTRTNSAAV